MINLVLELSDSQWSFNTYGSGGGGGAGFFAASGGIVTVDDPQGRSHQFRYGGVGAGVSAGIKLPKIGKIKLKRSGAVGPTSFPSKGLVLKSDNISSGSDLSPSNFRGICVYLDGGAGLVGGAGGSLMLFGIPAYAIPLISAPIVGPMLFLNNARGALIMGGVNVGVQAGAGISAQVGYMG
jgi:hypothetical protein